MARPSGNWAASNLPAASILLRPSAPIALAADAVPIGPPVSNLSGRYVFVISNNRPNAERFRARRGRPLLMATAWPVWIGPPRGNRDPARLQQLPRGVCFHQPQTLANYHVRYSRSTSARSPRRICFCDGYCKPRTRLFLSCTAIDDHARHRPQRDFPRLFRSAISREARPRSR
jgi:hypothetical protein